MDIFWTLPGVGGTPGIGEDTGAIPPRGRHITPAYLAQVARAVDSLGYSGLFLPPGAAGEEAWMTASALIPVTRQITFIIPQRPDTQSVTLAARMAATFDRLSLGRLILHLDSGDKTDPRPGTAEEFLRVWRDLFTGEPVTFEGQHVHIEGGRLTWPPVQRPHPPLMLAAAPVDRAARYANLVLLPDARPDEITPKVEAIREQARRADRSIRFAMRFDVLVRRLVSEAMADMEPGFPNRNGFTAWIGEPDQIAEMLNRYIDLGVEVLILNSAPHLEEAYTVAELLFPHLPAWAERAAARDQVFRSRSIPSGF
jgi:alkanesulfonate monooxygenase